MRPLNQTIHDADGGNCLTASIASILDLPIEAVPNFAAEHGDGWEDAAKAWLAGQGLGLISLGFASYETFAGTYFDNAGAYCLVCGPSSFPNRGHAVVGRVTDAGGIEIVHDPSPSSPGLPKGHRWVKFIVRKP